MKQITFLSVVFLPAYLVAVCLQVFSYLLIQSLIEIFWNEHARDRARCQWHCSTVHCDRSCIYTRHSVGAWCCPEQIYIPGGYDFLAATGLASTFCLPILCTVPVLTLSLYINDFSILNNRQTAKKNKTFKMLENLQNSFAEK